MQRPRGILMPLATGRRCCCANFRLQQSIRTVAGPHAPLFKGRACPFWCRLQLSLTATELLQQVCIWHDSVVFRLGDKHGRHGELPCRLSDKRQLWTLCAAPIVAQCSYIDLIRAKIPAVGSWKERLGLVRLSWLSCNQTSVTKMVAK